MRVSLEGGSAGLPVAVVPVLVPSPTPGSPPDQSDGELVPGETGALTVDTDADAELAVVSEATDSGADEAADDSVEGVSGTRGSADGEDGDSEPGDFEEGEEGDDGGHGLVDVPGVPGVPGLPEAEEAHGDGELEDGEVGGDTVTDGLAGFTGGGVLWSCRPVSPW
jgi:hypothetical protein